MFKDKLIVFNSAGMFYVAECIEQMSSTDIKAKNPVLLVPGQNGWNIATTPYENCNEVFFVVSSIAEASADLVKMYEQVRTQINAAKAGIVVTSKVDEMQKKNNKNILNLQDLKKPQ